mmetsp:Transcript_134633/g.288084  ORF Transcript_134633/g.288084 Transcript_134633/m.288084 type:complete len:462 (-) Transcript_134633:145-1530(-)
MASGHKGSGIALRWRVAAPLPMPTTMFSSRWRHAGVYGAVRVLLETASTTPRLAVAIAASNILCRRLPGLRQCVASAGRRWAPLRHLTGQGVGRRCLARGTDRRRSKPMGGCRHRAGRPRSCRRRGGSGPHSRRRRQLRGRKRPSARREWRCGLRRSGPAGGRSLDRRLRRPCRRGARWSLRALHRLPTATPLTANAAAPVACCRGSGRCGSGRRCNALRRRARLRLEEPSELYQLRQRHSLEVQHPLSLIASLHQRELGLCDDTFLLRVAQHVKLPLQPRNYLRPIFVLLFLLAVCLPCRLLSVRHRRRPSGCSARNHCQLPSLLGRAFALGFASVGARGGCGGAALPLPLQGALLKPPCALLEPSLSALPSVSLGVARLSFASLSFASIGVASLVFPLLGFSLGALLLLCVRDLRFRGLPGHIWRLRSRARGACRWCLLLVQHAVGEGSRSFLLGVKDA